MKKYFNIIEFPLNVRSIFAIMNTIKTDTKRITVDLGLTSQEELGQTILHCKIRNYGWPMRIWKSTFLIEDSGFTAKIFHTEGISIMPKWSFVRCRNGYGYFTLLFEALNRSTKRFYLDEKIPERLGFYSSSIRKNKTGVYHVELFTKA